MTVFTDDTAQERKQQKDQRTALDRASFDRYTAVKTLYRSPEGRAYLWWLLEVGRAIGQNPFRGDPNLTAFNCGEQNVGQQIMLHMIEVDPIAFAEMLKEMHNARSDTASGATGPGTAESSFWDAPAAGADTGASHTGAPELAGYD